MNLKAIHGCLLKSGILTPQEFVFVHIVLKIPLKMIDFILGYGAQKCGPCRYKQWIHSLCNGDYDILERNTTIDTIKEGVDCLSSGQLGEINRDVVRTYQTNAFFKEGQYGRTMLQRILYAVAKTRPDVGYCQGMNFVVGAMLIARMPVEYVELVNRIYDNRETEINSQITGAEVDHASETASTVTDLPQGDAVLLASQHPQLMLSEEAVHRIESDILQLMLQLLDKNSKLAMAGLWMEKVPRLKLRVYQLDRYSYKYSAAFIVVRLLRWNYPRLHAHFQLLQLSPEVITAQWFVTLFAYTLPLETTLHIWDYLFETGWEGVFKVAITFLGALEPQLLALEDLEGFAALMREWKRYGQLTIDCSISELLIKANRLVINQEVLSRLQEGFAQEVILLATVLAEQQEAEDMKKLQQQQGARDTSSHGGGGGGLLSNRSTPAPGNASPMLGFAFLGGTSSKEAQEEIRIRLGEELPTFWLQRYGQKLTKKQIRELLEFKLELRMLEQLVEVDKQQLHSKIVKACEYHRETQEELVESAAELIQLEDALVLMNAEFQTALIEAQNLAEAAAMLVEEENTLHANDKKNDGGLKPSSAKSAPVSQQSSPARHKNLRSLNAFIRENGLLDADSNLNLNSSSSADRSFRMSQVSDMAASHYFKDSQYSMESYEEKPDPRANSFTSAASTTVPQFDGIASLSVDTAKPKGFPSINALRADTAAAGPTAPTAPSTVQSSSRHSVVSMYGAMNNMSTHSMQSTADVRHDVHQLASLLVVDSANNSVVDGGEDAVLEEVGEAPLSTSFNDDLSSRNAISINTVQTAISPPDRPKRMSWTSLQALKDKLRTSSSEKHKDLETAIEQSPAMSLEASRRNSANAALPSHQTITRNRSRSDQETDHSSSTANSGAPTSSSTSQQQPPQQPQGFSWRPNGYVRRAIASGAMRLGQRVSNMMFRDDCASNEGGGGTPIHSSRHHEIQLQFRHLERQSQISQQKIIDLHRSLDELRKSIATCRQRVEYARINDDEALQWKKSLCDQLQLLVEDSNRGKSQKLIFISDNYLL